MRKTMDYDEFRNYVVDTLNALSISYEPYIPMEDVENKSVIEMNREQKTDFYNGVIVEDEKDTLYYTIRPAIGCSPAVKAGMRIDLKELFRDYQFDDEGSLFQKLENLTDSLFAVGYKITSEAFIDRLSDIERNRYDELKKLRAEIADQEGIRLYMVFDNRTLAEICHVMPDSLAHLQIIHGIGEKKAEKYGDKFLKRLWEIADSEKQKEELIVTSV